METLENDLIRNESLVNELNKMKNDRWKESIAKSILSIVSTILFWDVFPFYFNTSIEILYSLTFLVWFLTFLPVYFVITRKYGIKEASNNLQKIKDELKVIKELLTQEENKRRELEEQNKLQERKMEREMELQKSLLHQIGVVNQKAIEISRNLPEHILKINDAIHSTQKLYDASLFAPFWDKIEHTVLLIENYYNDIKNISLASKEYIKLLSEYNGIAGKVEPFPFNSDFIAELDKRDDINNSFNRVLQLAQSNINFASIYEMRKSNQLLTMGFTNLANAINGMSSSLSHQISSLQNNLRLIDTSISTMTDNISYSISDLSSSSSDYQSKIVDELRSISWSRK